MRVPEPILDATRRWIAYAQADLLEAQLNIAHGGVPFVACFHCQQAVEKAIKSAYVWQSEPFERVHDLDRLRNLLPGQWSFTTDFPDLSDLTFWSVQGRYPSSLADASTTDSANLYARASTVVQSILEDLS